LTTSAGAALAALVSISVAPDVPTELSALAVRSCDTALGEGKCQITGPSPVQADWHATVTASDPNLETVRIEVKKESGDSAPETRELSFSPEDAPRERWASVGVLIAAMVVAGSRDAEPAPPPSEPVPVAPPPPRPKPEPPKSPARPPRILRFDFRALAARRTAAGLPELGLELGASILPEGGPWFGAATITGAHRFGAVVGASWFSLGLGGGARMGAREATFAAEVRTLLVAEYWRFEASESGRWEQTGNFRIGGLAGVDGLWAVHEKWIVSLGVAGLVVSPRLRIDVEGRTVERVPEYGVLVATGLRFFP
jgi:hypothetical protein